MSARPKRLPRLWCALQGLLPLDACVAAQHGELAWPSNLPRESGAKPNGVRRSPKVSERKTK